MNAPAKPSMTPDGAELALLDEAAKHNDGITALPVGDLPDFIAQKAVERCILQEYIRLIDVGVVMLPGPMGKQRAVPGRIFRITAEGRKRRMELLVSAK